MIFLLGRHAFNLICEGLGSSTSSTGAPINSTEWNFNVPTSSSSGPFQNNHDDVGPAHQLYAMMNVNELNTYGGSSSKYGTVGSPQVDTYTAAPRASQSQMDRHDPSALAMANLARFHTRGPHPSVSNLSSPLTAMGPGASNVTNSGPVSAPNVTVLTSAQPSAGDPAPNVHLTADTPGPELHDTTSSSGGPAPRAVSSNGVPSPLPPAPITAQDGPSGHPSITTEAVSHLSTAAPASVAHPLTTTDSEATSNLSSSVPASNGPASGALTNPSTATDADSNPSDSTPASGSLLPEERSAAPSSTEVTTRGLRARPAQNSNPRWMVAPYLTYLQGAVETTSWAEMIEDWVHFEREFATNTSGVSVLSLNHTEHF